MKLYLGVKCTAYLLTLWHTLIFKFLQGHPAVKFLKSSCNPLPQISILRHTGPSQNPPTETGFSYIVEWMWGQQRRKENSRQFAPCATRVWSTRSVQVHAALVPHDIDVPEALPNIFLFLGVGSSDASEPPLGSPSGACA